jgi:hypothetical protein
VVENPSVIANRREPPSALSASGFGGAWAALCAAFALHIVDEASTGFLAVYNSTVITLRERWSWFSMPTFQFGAWLAVLLVACGLLFCLTPVASRGMNGLRPLAWAYAVIMFFNGLAHILFSILGHTVASVTFPRPAPGFYSSPFLMGASLWLMYRLRRSARGDFQLPTGD